MKKKCPIVKEECWEHGCQFFTHLLGKNPQTGVDEDQWGCAVTWLPILLIENAAQMRKATASMDKVASQVSGLRGEVNSTNQILFDASQTRLLDADPRIKIESKNGQHTGE